MIEVATRKPCDKCQGRGCPECFLSGYRYVWMPLEDAEIEAHAEKAREVGRRPK